MTRGRGGRAWAGDASALAAEAEGYLLARAHHDAAYREARALCAKLPWLTTAQAEEVTRCYVEQRIELARQTLRATVRRADELRQEYEARYRLLRRALLRRHAAGAAAFLACATAAGAAVSVVAR
ncbi:hypothetical protein [Streptomyces sp. NPDC052701]|uniref:hypothetical protein n=1 Tax=Streptomyces sp. NPDC052701 TaxID=3155533 RepID=UPI003415AAAD